MKRLISLFLLGALLIPASAGAAQESYTTSPWSAEAIAQSEQLGFLTTDVYTENDLRVPASRNEFRKAAVRFLAVQAQQDKLEDLVEYYLAEKDEQGEMKLVFQDDPQQTPRITDRGNSIAYYLGIVEGRRPGYFAPEATLTREEAAVMLTRTYKALGGTLPEAAGLPFPDQDSISDWAKDSVAVLCSWNVLQGKDNGRFDPKGTFTREQCAAAFLRLYENAPVSRKNGNVPAPFSYSQILEMLDKQDAAESAQPSMYQINRWEGPKATMIHAAMGGVTISPADTYFVYRDGRVRLFDLEFHNIWGMMTSSVRLSDGQFSDSGDTFTCTLTLSNDIRPGQGTTGDAVPRKAGVYRITVDVETLESTAERVGDL